MSYIQESLRSFYSGYDPVDVEVQLTDSTSVRFSPAKYLKKLQGEYDMTPASFIFATKDGDPIYLKSDGSNTKEYLALRNRNNQPTAELEIYESKGYIKNLECDVIIGIL
ncbi:hypothetical protein J3A84_08695 [Proteiniclasticum sp. SCR006]|uniref:Uncharacterized protein n=1 Tax=Proteiniclasticum aestuarii TaxID=2817862 RepID=A0A939H8J3_9CLOT|nr:hypothetical protein [Proteiniclasticum aestuarii]MBO1265101.1 hypothetical protein [Proteiniclasticum aestuarii]